MIENTSSINSRIREIINITHVTDNAFAKKIGVTQSVIASMFQRGTEPSAKILTAILSTFTDISAEWLLRGKGTMLLSDVEHERNIIPDSNLERMNRLVDTIATLQGALNEKDKTIKLLEEKVKRLETELAMVKNEWKVG